MLSRSKFYVAALGVTALIVSFLASGCAPLLVAGGAVGGYAIAKNADDQSTTSKK